MTRKPSPGTRQAGVRARLLTLRVLLAAALLCCAAQSHAQSPTSFDPNRASDDTTYDVVTDTTYDVVTDTTYDVVTDTTYDDSTDTAYDDSTDTAYDDDYWAPALTPQEVDTRVREVLSRQAMHFCNDPEHVLYRGERPLCAFAEAAKERCPALPQVCARPSRLDRVGAGFGGGSGGSSRGARDWFDDSESKEYRLTLPQGLGQVLRLLFWAFAIAAAITVLYLVAKNWMFGSDRTPEEASEPTESEAPVPLAPGLSEEVERDVKRLLDRAHAHARAGRIEAALNDVHAALLRYLEARALLRLHRSKTNGDHVRALAAHPQLQGVLREVVNDLERVQFGKNPASSDKVVGLLGQVTHLIGPALWCLLIAASSVALCACKEVPAGRGATDNWGVTADTSAAGFSVLAELLSAQEREVKNHVGGFEKIDDTVDTLVVYDSTDLNDEDWADLEKWAAQGHHLVIAGEHSGARYFGVGLDGPECARPPVLTAEYGGPKRAEPPIYGHPATLTLTAPVSTLELEEATATPITCDNAPLVAQRQLEQGDVTFLANADLFANASMAAANNAPIMLGLLGEHGTVKFAGAMAGAGTESPYEALADARLAPLLWQGLLVLLIFYFGRGAAFRPARDPEQDRRQEFIRHIHALGRAYSRGKAASHALRSYAAWALDRLKERVRPGTRMSLVELAESVAKRTGRPQNEVLEVLAEAATSKGNQSAARERDLSTLRQLEKLVMETKGTR